MTDTSVALDQIRVRYATFRDRSVAERAAFGRGLQGVHTRERVLLETCHRVELASVDDTDEPRPSATGRDAVRRVFEVVAGLDSAVIAEEQLLGQARAAYETALARRSSGPILNELFRRALRFGRRVRSQAIPGADRSLADVGARWLVERLGTPPRRVVVAGTGAMGRLLAERLSATGHALTIASRSPERAKALVRRLGGAPHLAVTETLPMHLVGSAAGIVLAIRPREPLLDVHHVASRLPLRAVLDLSTPAAVTAGAADLLGERLMSVDRLGEMAGTSGAALSATVVGRLRSELAAEVDRFAAWVEARQTTDAVVVLRDEAEAIRRRHLERVRRRAGLAADQLAAVEAASTAMMAELLHGPSVELRAGGADADAVRRIFRLGR